MLNEVQPPIMSDLPSVRLAIDRAYGFIGQLSRVSSAQIDMLKTLAASGVVTPAQLATINQQLTIIGSAPIITTGLIGSGDAVTFGDHAERLSTSPSGFFYETDRTALYAADGGSTWVLVASMMFGSPTDRPADLASNDIDFLYFQQGTDGNIVWSWSGSDWYAAVGQQNGALSAIPAASNKLTGSYYYATDFDRMYLVGAGPAWQDAPGQPQREMVCFFTTAPGVGWQLCDGSAGVTISTSTGGTSTITVPNLTGALTFIAANAGVATGNFGAVGVNYAYQSLLPFIRL